MENKKEQYLSDLLTKLRSEPFAAEREELGQMLFRHVDSYSPKEKNRYDELKEILRGDKPNNHYI